MEGTDAHKSAFFWIIFLSLICMGADLLAPLLLQQTVDEGIALRDISCGVLKNIDGSEGLRL